MNDDQQIPQLTPEMQLFVKKKQLFMGALTQAISNGLKEVDGITEDQFKFLYADLHNTVPTTQQLSTIDFMIQNGGYKVIIFSHEFLKAFFGEYWWEHGSAILKLEQPLLYLEQFIKPVQPQKNEWR